MCRSPLAGEVQKGVKLNEKNSSTTINPEKNINIHALAWKIHTWEILISEKKIPAARKFPTPITFCNGPFLIATLNKNSKCNWSQVSLPMVTGSVKTNKSDLRPD